MFYNFGFESTANKTISDVHTCRKWSGGIFPVAVDCLILVKQDVFEFDHNLFSNPANMTLHRCYRHDQQGKELGETVVFNNFRLRGIGCEFTGTISVIAGMYKELQRLCQRIDIL